MCVSVCVIGLNFQTMCKNGDITLKLLLDLKIK